MTPNVQRRLIVATTIAVAGIAASVYCGRALIEALQRGHMVRSLGDLRSLGMALEAYRSEHRHYPSLPPLVTSATLAPYLVPAYTVSIPVSDSWGRPYLVTTTPTHYEVWSLGRDGQPGPNASDGPTHDWDADVEYADGKFVRYPDYIRP